jgi:DNA-binding transcriptional regulator YhcF (GntR family)
MDGITIDTASPVPPYEQLRSRIAARAADGTLAAGTRLPTVRALATDLGLAVNTVARAYKELESDGVVVTEGRRGTFVRSPVVSGADAARAPDARSAADAYVAAARRLGLTVAEATALVERAWTGREH